MSSDLARSVLILTALALQGVAGLQAGRDRGRRERETRVRPQPLRDSTAGKWVLGLSMAALAGAVVTLFG